MHDGINSARREALSACTGVEAAGSAMASMPHYMSQGVNALTAHGVEKAINGLMSMLTLSVTAVEEIVVFVINLLTSTYVCLITLVVAGSLHAAIALIEDVTGFLNKTLGAIGDDLQGAATDFEKGLNGIVGGLNSIGHAFGSHDNIPKLNIDNEISALHSLQLPSGINEDLEKLNSSIPTFAQVNNFTNNAIRFPFEEIKTLISNHTGHYKFDQSLFPVPKKEQLSFCSGDDGIDPFFNGLIDLIYDARKIAVGVLVTLALLVIIPMAWRELRSHRIQQERAAMMNSGHEPMDVVYLASRPTSSGVGLMLASKVKTDRKKALIRWAIAYATTVPALFVLSLAIAGLFACLCRYIILQTVTKAIPDIVHDIDGFSHKVMASLDNASMAWANGSNTIILDMNARINHDIFGWVNISTHALNETLNVFVDESIQVLNETFGGTILYGPVTELFNCLIGLKVAGIEKGLTWISDNAHVDFPLLPANTFSLGGASKLAANNSDDPEASNFLANPANGTTDAVGDAVHALINHVYNSIRTEALISTGVLAVWVIIALIGIIRAAFLFYGKGNTADLGTDIPSSTDPHTPGKRYSGSFISAESPPHEKDHQHVNQPTLPAVGILSEKQMMANNLTPTRDPFADPRDPPEPPQMQTQTQSQLQQPAQAACPSSLATPIPLSQHNPRRCKHVPRRAIHTATSASPSASTNAASAIPLLTHARLPARYSSLQSSQHQSTE